MSYEDLLKKAIETMPKDIDDKDRFKIPKIKSEIHGNRTIIRNFNEILTSLRREDHLSKFLFRDLATSGSVQNGMLTFQGNFQQSMLQNKLEKYIKEFMYCKKCGEPDTKIVKDGQNIFMVCEACGHKAPIRSL